MIKTVSVKTRANLGVERLPFVIVDYRVQRLKGMIPCAGSIHAHGVGVGVGVGDPFTTLKLTLIEAPWLPVPPVELHGVATSV